MINNLKNVMSRIKRYILLIIGLPVLLGALGYFIEVNTDEQGSAIADVKISLGNYDNPEFNHSENVQLMLTSNHILSDVFTELDETEIMELSQKIKVDRINQTTISITYQGETEEEASEVLERFTSHFLALDQNEFEEKKSIVEENINRLENETVGPDAIVEKHRFLYELDTQLKSMSDAKIIEPISAISSQATDGLSPKKRAVLGALIGLIVMAGFVVVPELLKEN